MMLSSVRPLMLVPPPRATEPTNALPRRPEIGEEPRRGVSAGEFGEVERY